MHKALNNDAFHSFEFWSFSIVSNFVLRYSDFRIFKVDDLVKSHKIDGTEKSSRCKARESLGMRRT